MRHEFVIPYIENKGGFLDLVKNCKSLSEAFEKQAEILSYSSWLFEQVGKHLQDVEGVSLVVEGDSIFIDGPDELLTKLFEEELVFDFSEMKPQSDCFDCDFTDCTPDECPCELNRKE